jgi:hypothetical protein
MSDHEPTSRTTRTVPLAYPAERVGPRCLNDPATTWLGASGHGMGCDSIENTMATSSQAHLVHRSLNIQQRIHPDQEETRQAGGIDSKPSHTQGIESHRPSPDTPTPRGHLSCRTQHDSEIDRLAPAAVVYRPRRWPCQRRHRMRQVRDSVRCSLLDHHTCMSPYSFSCNSGAAECGPCCIVILRACLPSSPTRVTQICFLAVRLVFELALLDADPVIPPHRLVSLSLSLLPPGLPFTTPRPPAHHLCARSTLIPAQPGPPSVRNTQPWAYAAELPSPAAGCRCSLASTTSVSTPSDVRSRTVTLLPPSSWPDHDGSNPLETARHAVIPLHLPVSAAYRCERPDPT